MDLKREITNICNRLIINYNPDFSLNFSPEIEKWFQQEWGRKLLDAKQRNILLFNGPLFHVSDVVEIEGKVKINIGNTDYRAYVCSRSPEFKNKFPDYISSKPLAACVALLTTDNKLLVEKRKGVDVHEGMYHVVGGFLDPSKDLDKYGIPDPFGSVGREVKEETGLRVYSDKLFFLGIEEDRIVPHHELCFFSQLTESSDQVEEIFNNSLNDGEFNQPEFIDFTEKNINEFLQNNTISPTGKKCISLSIKQINALNSNNL